MGKVEIEGLGMTGPTKEKEDKRPDERFINSRVGLRKMFLVS